MLKFLQNKSSNKLPVKPLLKYHPQLIYGHTKDSPSQFLNKHSIYFTIKQQANLPTIKPISKQTKKKESLHKLQTFKIDSQYRKYESQQRRLRIDTEIKGKNQRIFNITRGQFTTFLDKHKHYGSIGTLHKQNLQTNTNSPHKLTWNKSNNLDQNNSIEIKSYQTSSLFHHKSSLPSQSILSDTNQYSKQSYGFTRSSSMSIFEKVKRSQLKQKKKEFQDSIRKQAKRRLERKCQHFGLPKVGVQHELFLLEKRKFGQEKRKSELEELNTDIDRFENSLFYKFK